VIYFGNGFDSPLSALSGKPIRMANGERATAVVDRSNGSIRHGANLRTITVMAL
jgi:hypothetical protein